MAKMSPTSIIVVFVSIIIGASFVPALAAIILNGQTASYGRYLWTHNDSWHSSVYNVTGLTGASWAIYGLLTLFFVIVIAMVAVRVIQRSGN